MSRHVLEIRRSIWYVLVYCSGPAEGHMYDHELFYLCLYNEAGRAGIRLELPLYPNHVAVGRPRCAMMVWAPAPRHQSEVTICASSNFWLGR